MPGGEEPTGAHVGGAPLEALIALLRDGAAGRRRHPVDVAPLDRQHPLTLALRDPDRAAAVAALAALGAGAVPHLISALDSGSRGARAALLALEKIGDARAAPAILRQLQRRGALVRAHAVRTLVALGSSAVADLTSVPADSRGLVDVLQALGRIADPRAIPFLARLVEHPRRAVRAEATRALEALGTLAIAPLVDHVVRRSAGVLEAAHALGNLGDARAAGPLAALLRHPRDDVRHAAASGLIRIGPAAVEPAAVVLASGGLGAFEAASVLARIHDDAVEPPLRAALVHGPPEIRRAAAIGLGQLLDRHAPPELIACAADPLPSVRAAALWALGRRRDQAGADAAITAARADDAPVRRAAARALGQLAPDAPVLRDLLDDPLAPGVRATASWALSQGRATDVPALARLLGDTCWHVRCAALDALIDLGWQPQSPAERAVLALADRDGPSLASLGAEGVEWLIGTLGSEDTRMRRAAVEGLSAIGAAAGPALVEALDHSDVHVRAGAAAALGAIGDAGVAPRLAAALHDSDPHVARSAARALNWLGDFRGDCVPPHSPAELAAETAVDYEEILAASPDLGIDGLIVFLSSVLPREWAAVYRALNPHCADLSIPTVSGFDYLFDSSSLFVARGGLAADTAVADRVVAVCGRTRTLHGERDETRMKGAPLGTVELMYPPRKRRYDKGHFMGHALGGGVDINLFPQVAATNRGASEAGRRFRALERYALERPGTFCFARPLYSGFSDHPLLLEYGVLRQDGTLWVESFCNVASVEEARAIERTYRQRALGRAIPW